MDRNKFHFLVSNRDAVKAFDRQATYTDLHLYYNIIEHDFPLYCNSYLMFYGGKWIFVVDGIRVERYTSNLPAAMLNAISWMIVNYNKTKAFKE